MHDAPLSPSVLKNILGSAFFLIPMLLFEIVDEPRDICLLLAGGLACVQRKCARVFVVWRALGSKASSRELCTIQAFVPHTDRFSFDSECQHLKFLLVSNETLDLSDIPSTLIILLLNPYVFFIFM